MSGFDRLPDRSSGRARRDVALLVLRALGQVVLLVPRLVREAVCAPGRRRAMAELLRESAARGSKEPSTSERGP